MVQKTHLSTSCDASEEIGDIKVFPLQARAGVCRETSPGMLTLSNPASHDDDDFPGLKASINRTTDGQTRNVTALIPHQVGTSVSNSEVAGCKWILPKPRSLRLVPPSQRVLNSDFLQFGRPPGTKVWGKSRLGRTGLRGEGSTSYLFNGVSKFLHSEGIKCIDER